MTRDLVPLEPKVEELKFYAPEVGPLLSVHTDGAGGRAELISYTPGKQPVANATSRTRARPWRLTGRPLPAGGGRPLRAHILSSRSMTF